MKHDEPLRSSAVMLTRYAAAVLLFLLGASAVYFLSTQRGRREEPPRARLVQGDLRGAAPGPPWPSPRR